MDWYNNKLFTFGKYQNYQLLIFEWASFPRICCLVQPGHCLTRAWPWPGQNLAMAWPALETKPGARTLGSQASCPLGPGVPGFPDLHPWLCHGQAQARPWPSIWYILTKLLAIDTNTFYVGCSPICSNKNTFKKHCSIYTWSESHHNLLCLPVCFL